jgi:hypothetical protein
MNNNIKRIDEVVKITFHNTDVKLFALLKKMRTLKNGPFFQNPIS